MTRKEDQDNIVHFPGLTHRLADKGMRALKEKEPEQAVTYFEQIISIEPEHAQARYGIVLAHVELENLEEAKKHCRSMLEEGIGDYYEVMQVYISILVQLGDYEEVTTMLEGVMEEDRLPADKAEHFYELLHFAREMTTTHPGQKMTSAFPPKELEERLEQGRPPQQLGAMQQLKQYDQKEVKKVYRSFLKDNEQHPVLKSYMLEILRELECFEQFEVCKFQECWPVTVSENMDLGHKEFGYEVLELLKKDFTYSDPSLQQLIEDVWWHFLFALYPKEPKPLKPDVWAEALYRTGRRLMYSTLEEDREGAAADEQEVEEAEAMLEKIEQEAPMME
ncbi:tetratricopeptide repeat protein [Alkalicoccus chagannorensis]|uniref:tetratricopeptide repeat protein n=1 Tax=Alkalicoccus chagannorensis TaxID=427072 RepID=UPI00040E4A27|nr:tetratricopeptide repeat protein [Alkalicoccus chagannorensis]